MTNKEKVMTKAEIYRTVIAVLNGESVPENVKEQIVERMNKDIESTFRKASTTSKKHNAANDELKEKILEVMNAEPARLFSATEITRAFDFEYSVQKITSLLKQLKDAEMVTKTVDKKKVYFQVCV